MRAIKTLGIFGSKNLAKQYYQEINDQFQEEEKFELTFFKETLCEDTAILAKFDAVSVYTTDIVNENVMKVLKENGVKVIAIRSNAASYVDLESAKKYGIKVVAAVRLSISANASLDQ